MRYHTMQALRYRAILIQKSLGTQVAAGFLRNRGMSLEGAVALLVRHV